MSAATLKKVREQPACARTAARQRAWLACESKGAPSAASVPSNSQTKGSAAEQRRSLPPSEKEPLEPEIAWKQSSFLL